MVIMKEVCTRETTVEVDTIDSGISNIMQRDSNMEVEMMELFEDLTLEDIVAKKACVGKRRIVKWLWRGDHGWLMESFSICDPGRLKGRKEDVVRRGFLRCWIDVWISHPFPAGFFLKAGANPSSWIQFKYDKLPFLCFNCGRLAHVTGKCSAPTMWVTPATGQAVRMYGPWIKVDGARGNCFTARGNQTELMVNDEGPSFLKLSRPNGKWRRRSDVRPEQWKQP
ncbi:hypothetical protein F8388_019819 [Cannabis sativa]|uniref:Zinc knuckle CX2CX4HX4C domain-containing protein n=1 Tax=Cannabis sativa TaxID=3483 RepID=A0A7J6HM41_CANSA|nr:hypothetical protein F8388_019819 [Cannabis sativa]